MASTKLLRNLSKVDFRGPSSHPAKFIYSDESVNEFFIRIQTIIQEADLKYFLRKLVKQQSASPYRAESVTCWIAVRICSLYSGIRNSAEDIDTYRKVCNQYRNEIEAHQKSIQTRVMNVACQNKLFLSKYMQCSEKNKPSAFLPKLGEIPTTGAVLVENGFRDYFVSVYADSFDEPHLFQRQ